MKKSIVIIIFIVALLGGASINGYYLPPGTFPKRILLLKIFDFYSNLQPSNSFVNMSGFKEQYGLTNRINIYAMQPAFIYKKMIGGTATGFGDLRQGIIVNLLNFRERNNLELIVSSKIPTGYMAKTQGEISLGTGTYDTHIEILGNYFYRLLELRYYTSFVKKIGSGKNISESDNFLTIAGHILKRKAVLMLTLTYNYRFNDKTYNSYYIGEMLYKFNKRVFAKAGAFFPIEDNNVIKSDYKILAEFYYFLR
ncbi:MAG: hypothetical protein GWP03_01940 [Proteobacteria bacterium]|nr:hypothetical protein [Pseudomonadota bacterium]